MVVRGWVRHATIDWNSVRGCHMIRAPIASMRELLSDDDLVDGNTRKRFEGWARGDYRDVHFEIDTRIASEMKGGYVGDYNDLDFEAHRKDAEALMEEGLLDVASWAYRGMTESIGTHFNCMDDSGGYVWPFFEECMDNLGRCIAGQNLQAEKKRQTIEYLAGWSLVTFEDFMGYYDRVLEKVCTSADDLRLWGDILKSGLDLDDRPTPYDWDTAKMYIQKRYSRVLGMMENAKSLGGD